MVSTPICIDFNAESSNSAALTLVVIVASSTYSPAVSRPDIAAHAAREVVKASAMRALLSPFAVRMAGASVPLR
jgi:hypothetical protein